jgi:hypothetical protein
VDKVKTEKADLQQRMKAMEQQLLSGGTKIEEQPEFHAAVGAVEGP